MADYRVGQAPHVETPDAQHLVEWMERELRTLAQTLQSNTILPTDQLHAAPAKPRVGMVAYADGSDWDPGNGAGLYVYKSGGWQFLEYRAPQSLTAYMQKANNLSDVANAATARSNLGLGSAALLTAGTGANNAVQLDGSAKLPAVDGSQLINISHPSAGQPIPSSSAPTVASDFAVGSLMRLVQYGSASSIGDGSSTSGSNLRTWVYDGAITDPIGISLSGTWQNVGGYTCDQYNVTEFVRTA